MSKQKLIDLNEFPARRVGPDDCLTGRMYACGWNGVIHLLEEAPVIDPEDLPIVKELRSELKSYKDLGVTPEQIALLIKFFKTKTSAACIAADMKLIAGYLNNENVSKQLLETEQKLQKSIDCISSIEDDLRKDDSNYFVMEHINKWKKFVNGESGMEACEWCCDEILFDSEDMKFEMYHPLKDEPQIVKPRYCPMCGRPLAQN